MGAVSSTLIALGFLAQVVTRLDRSWAGLLLPALFVLGELTFAALVRYRGRNVVERCFDRLKQFRAVATCWDDIDPQPGGVCRPG
jgi:transposase